MSIALLNGAFVPLESASVSVLDRGFLFGDAIYEVIPAFAGKLFRLPRHLKRLRRNLESLQLPLEMSNEELKGLLSELLERNGSGNLSIYLQVTRGPGKSRDHAFPKNCKPTVFAMVNEMPPLDTTPDPKGIAVIVLGDIRWQRCDIKATTLLANCLLKQQALDSGADDAILTRNNYAMESTAANLFVVSDGVIATPAKQPFMLPGVTRDLVVQLARDNQIPLEERPIPVAELESADEIWLTSSTREIRPVTRCNDKVVGTGVGGPVWEEMVKQYQGLKRKLYHGEIYL